MKTPLRYPGGKSKAYDLITPHLFSKSYPKTIISPFLGGGSLESRWASEKMVQVLGFDIFSVLVNFWSVLLSEPQKLYEEASKLSLSDYDQIKEQLLSWSKSQALFEGWATNHYARTPIELDPIIGAAYYFFNHNLSYGPQYLGWLSSIYTPKKWEDMCYKLKNYRNPNLVVAESSFEKVIEAHPNEVLYLDPPYFLEKSEDNKMFKGLYPNGNFAVHHNSFDHEKLRDLLHSHNGRFVLSYNDCEEVRKYYEGFDFYFPEWAYSYGQGETRVGKNKQDTGNTPKASHEILIVKK